MTPATFKKLAITYQVVFFLVFAISFFLPKGELRTATNITLLALGVIMMVLAYNAKRKREKMKKNLKRVRDELLEQQWEEKHRI
ncbi:MAG: hypothetical protein ACHQM6_09330 [Candidatus Kapaibacterium sp.]